MITYFIRTIALGAAIAVLGAASAAEIGNLSLTFAGSGKAETFAPTVGPAYTDLGMLKGRAQFGVSWSATSGTYGKPDYRMLSLATTAPKDGSAIQGMVLSDDRSAGFALYQPTCLLNTQDHCDIKAVGVDLNTGERTIRFKDARFLGQVEDGPEYVVVNGVLHY
ncbi:MAG: hypothetical protein ABI411_20105 [Tahibacter sp.]